jgi:UDP-3-O-[3-hydroxymyristoyl] glucosamine N-acyltransferase
MLLSRISEAINGVLKGRDVEITGVSSLFEAGSEDISFLSNPKYTHMALTSKAGAIIVSSMIDKEIPQVVVPNPYLGFALTLKLLYPQKGHKPGVSPLAFVGNNTTIGESSTILPHVCVGENVEVGEKCVIYPGCFIGDGCRISDGCILYPNVVVYDGCIIGRECIVHSGVVIGGDGFGFVWDGAKHLKIPQKGIVRIGESVEIGANCTIDRAALTETVIGNDVKIDDMVHIAHNVTVGDHSIIVAQSGIAGSSTLGRHVTIAGQCGVVGHVSIGDGSVVASKSGVHNDLKPGSIVSGTPAIDHKKWLRVQAVVKNLPELLKRVQKLERRFDAKD